ncbi:hypothetical protein RJT34_10672 [Clitoria ternatea]|uniref:Uncharacterized protein n=1 Tax=Clitoria ternatea TaxID=43366 RepID=A0AAN9JM42_CLITE
MFQKFQYEMELGFFFVAMRLELTLHNHSFHGPGSGIQGVCANLIVVLMEKFWCPYLRILFLQRNIVSLK